jgi:Rrf2 family protein
MWLSSTAQQALRAVLCIAGSESEGAVRVDEIAAALDCPRNYLSKTLHALTLAGVLRSERGPRGGFRLAGAADRLALATVIAPFEPIGERRCLLGRATCGDADPCAAHQRWRALAGGMETFFRTTTIAQLLRENPRAAEEMRQGIRSARHPNPRKPHGPVRRRSAG